MDLRKRQELGTMKIAIFESYARGDEDAIIPFEFTSQTTASGFLNHARDVISVIRSFVPNAEIYLLPFNNMRAREYVIKNDIRLVNISLAVDKVYSHMEAMAEKTFIVQAVGNYGERGEVGGAVWDKCCAVGAVGKDLQPKVYSGYGKDAVDTVAMVDLDYGHGRLGGTSFAAPVITGLSAQYMLWYQRQTGYFPPVKTMVDFVRLNSHDIWDDGKDLRTGYGLMRLPKKFEATRVDVMPGRRYVTKVKCVEGEPDKLTQSDLLIKSLIVDSRLMIPVRGTADTLGVGVEWDPIKRIASLLY